MADEPVCMICLDGSGTMLRKGCACRGSGAWAHAECMARAVVSQVPRRGECAWSECQTCGQHFTGQMTLALAAFCQRPGLCIPAMEHAMSLRATALQSMGAYHEAERIFRDVLASRIARYGHTHAATLVIMGKLASAMQQLWHDENKRAESEALWRGVAAVRTRSLGAEHPLTLVSKASLALALAHPPVSDEAEQLFEETIDAQTRVLGSQHAHTLATKHNYASMLSRLGDNAAAEPVFRAVVAAHRRLMGDLHPHTMLMCGNLAQCLANQHRYDEAKAIYDRTAESMRNVLGPMHPDTQEYSRRARLYGAPLRPVADP
jgi:tetratricopeptide (TPR) repeat protein